MGKGPEVGMSLACSVNSKEAGVAGADWVRGRVAGDEIREETTHRIEVIGHFNIFGFKSE